MTDGVTQDARLPEAFEAPLVAVDATTLPELLVMTQKLADRLQFIAAHNQPDGDWSRLLDHDETVAIAQVQTLGLDRRAEVFLDDFTASRLARMKAQVDDLLAWLDAWSGTLRRMDERIHGDDLAWAKLLSRRAEAVRVAALDDPSATRQGQPGPDSLEGLRRTYFALSKGISELGVLAQNAWSASLRRHNHEPAASLLIAFCQMLGVVQSRLNGFSDRLIDFYYEQVLQMRRRPPAPDRAHLLFERDPTYAPRVEVAKGTPFVVEARGAPAVTFRADAALTVTDVRVEALHTLRLQRDAQISLEAQLGFVTGARADRFGADVGRDDEARQLSAALFGADARTVMRQGADARIGLAVSSPALWLKEGERRISLTLRFDFGGETIEGLRTVLREAHRLATAALEARQPIPDEARAAFSQALGRLFARWVLPDTGLAPDEPPPGGPDPAWTERARRYTDAVLAEMRELAQPFVPDIETFRVRRGVVDDNGDGHFEDERFAPTDPLVLLLARREADYPEESRRNLIRDEVIENLFHVELSTPTDWLKVHRPVLTEALREPGAAGRHAMTLVLTLANEDPPITACAADVHGEGWPADAPVVRLTANRHAGIFPSSLLAGTVLRSVQIEVGVQGVRDVQAYNQLGLLDPSRPFMPFGPLPNTASYLVIGSAELAQKHPTSIVLHPEWSGLPAHGFGAYYDGYEGDYDADAFKVSTAILRDGVWPTATGPLAPLFRKGTPPRGQDIVVDAGDVRARWRASGPDFAVSPTERQGLVRVQLARPEGAFGHEAYPALLTKAVAERARNKRAPAPPNPPYTPLLERITLSYTAVARLDLSADGAGKALKGERVLHLHPFGVEEIYPRGAERAHGLIPDLGRDGNLYIGLSGKDTQGVLTLLFDLRRDAAVDELARREPRPRLEWSYLVGDQWRQLDPSRVLSDTTSGFLVSGIVTLDLPPGLTRSATVMPGDRCWLRLSCDAPSGCFAGLKGVRAQALQATRVLDGPPPVEPLRAGAITLNSVTLPGLLALEQREPGFALRPAETTDQFRARVGERLRHKGRALTPWDYERLVLDQFPFVHKVRCLAHRRDDAPGRAPGHVLVVALPDVPRNDARYSTRPMRLDPLQLGQIEDHLRALAPPGVKLKVRNPSYDLIQVRCRVTLAPGCNVGDALRDLNAGIIAYLSPWHDDAPAGGAEAASARDRTQRRARFDWEIRTEEIEACLRGMPNVREVSALSLIHVWEEQADENRGAFRFRDTASATPEDAVLVRHRQPWSLALPMDEHFIEVETADGDIARRTGLTTSRVDGARTPGVQVGRTFVVDRAR